MLAKKTIYFAVTNDIVGDQRMQRICRSLALNNYEVLIIGINKGRAIDQNLPYNIVLLNMCFNNGILFYLEYNLRVITLCLNKKFDAVTSVDIDTIIACKIISVFKKIKLIFDAHEYYVNVPELNGRPVKRLLWRLIEKIFVRQVSMGMTVNRSLASIFTERYKFSFHVIRNIPESSNTISQPKKLPRNKIILIYQGALNVGRGLEFYVEAMSQLRGCILWICGTGDINRKLSQLVKTSDASERILMKGFLAPDDLREVTNQAHIGLNMLDPGSMSYYYSLANRYFDYIYAGLPSIHMDFPEYREYNEEIQTGILLKEYSVNALVAAITSLIRDPELYHEMSMNCIIAGNSHKWDDDRKKLIRLYNNVLLNG